MEKIRVAIIEDEIEWLKIMSKLINNEDDMVVVSSATNRNDASSIASNRELDVILMDINLTGNNKDGIHAAAEISLLSNVKIIMMTSLFNEEIVMDSFKAGAVNYIPKEDFERIPDAIRSAHFNHSIFEIVLKDYLRLKENEILDVLSVAEKEIMHLVIQGFKKSEIEEKLHKTDNTIKSQIKGILKKLEVNTLKDALRKVKKRGL